MNMNMNMNEINIWANAYQKMHNIGNNPIFISNTIFPHASWIRWCHLFSDALGQQCGYSYAIGCSLIQYSAAANHDEIPNKLNLFHCIVFVRWMLKSGL